MANREYRRLTRPRRRRLGFLTAFPSARASLWLGADHVLQVSTTLGSEEYKRFHFKDIQAITIRGTERRFYLNILFASLLILSLAMVYMVAGRSQMRTLIPITFILFGVPMLINGLLGPTCDVQLRTAVQIEDLPSLSRIRRTHRVLDRIRPLIVSAQGQLTPEEISTRLRAMERPAISRRPSVTSPLGLSSMLPIEPDQPPAGNPESGAP